MRAYSNDLREKVIKALQQGQKAKDVAVRFDVCISWVYKIRKRFIDTGSYEALPRPGAPRKFSDDDINKLYELVKNNPSATLDELRTMGNFHVGRTTIHRLLRNKLKITYKKVLYAKEQNRKDVIQKRIEWEARAKTWDINKLVFLDESSIKTIKTAMVRLYGRGLKGERVKDYIPDARWRSLSILSSLRSDGGTEALVKEV